MPLIGQVWVGPQPASIGFSAFCAPLLRLPCLSFFSATLQKPIVASECCVAVSKRSTSWLMQIRYHGVSWRCATRRTVCEFLHAHTNVNARAWHNAVVRSKFLHSRLCEVSHTVRGECRSSCLEQMSRTQKRWTQRSSLAAQDFR